MRHSPLALRRGAVLLAADQRHYLILSTDGAAQHVCAPIVPQYEPRSRWDYPLADGDAPGIRGQRMLVRTNPTARRIVDIDGAVVYTHMTESALAMLDALLSRAMQTAAVEARYRMAVV